MCNLKTSFMISDLIMISIFGIHMETHVYIYYSDHIISFWIWFLWHLFYYSDHIILFWIWFLYFILHLCDIYHTCALSRLLPCFLISNPKYTLVLLLTSFNILFKFKNLNKNIPVPSCLFLSEWRAQPQSSVLGKNKCT